MVRSLTQLRIGVTRDHALLYRACIRGPRTVTVGRSDDALCTIDAPQGPDAHPLFLSSDTGCTLELRAEWPFMLYRRGELVDGAQLDEEGITTRRGDRIFMALSPGARGFILIGTARILFKWEEIPEDHPGPVPLREGGLGLGCHACAQPLTGALAHAGLLARCTPCRAMNVFTHPDSVARATDDAPAREEAAHGAAWSPESSEDKAEVDTLIDTPLFEREPRAPDPLPEHVRPAGVPLPSSAASSAAESMAAAAGMRTVFARSPFFRPRRTRRKKPKSPEAFQAFLELPAIQPLAPPSSSESLGSTAASAEDGPPAPGASKGVQAPCRSVDSGAPADGMFPSDEVQALDAAFYTAELEALDSAEASTLPGATASTDGEAKAPEHAPPRAGPPAGGAEPISYWAVGLISGAVGAAATLVIIHFFG